MKGVIEHSLEVKGAGFILYVFWRKGATELSLGVKGAGFILYVVSKKGTRELSQQKNRS